MLEPPKVQGWGAPISILWGHLPGCLTLNCAQIFAVTCKLYLRRNSQAQLDICPWIGEREGGRGGGDSSACMDLPGPPCWGRQGVEGCGGLWFFRVTFVWGPGMSLWPLGPILLPRPRGACFLCCALDSSVSRLLSSRVWRSHLQPHGGVSAMQRSQSPPDGCRPSHLQPRSTGSLPMIDHIWWRRLQGDAASWI